MTQTSDPQGKAVLQPGASQNVQVSSTITVSNQDPATAGRFTITIGTRAPQDNTIDPSKSTTFPTGGSQSVTVVNTGKTVLGLNWT